MAKINKKAQSKSFPNPTNKFCYKTNGVEISGDINDSDVKTIAYREQIYKYLKLFLMIILAIVFKEKGLCYIPVLLFDNITSLFKAWKMPP